MHIKLIQNLFINDIILLFIVYTLTYAQSTTPPINTENGAVIGTMDEIDGNDIYSFKGIPYAKPPIGDLRFRPPEPVNNWNGTYNAITYGSPCFQLGLGFTEDCLYLNIFTPTLIKSSNLSVMIWIYGGAFIAGDGSEYNIYNGTYLASRNVVVVTFNYRLGIFGFLYGNSSEAPGNAALWDQVMAINWTRRNIANFGGNPNDITLFGESAGSMSITDLIVSNASYGIRNWFNKAILFSGTVYLIRGAEDAYELSRNYARDKQNCYNDSEWIDCLKRVPALVLNSDQIIDQVFIYSLIFTPIYGDSLRLIPYNPYDAVKQGYFRQDITILMNHNEMEGALFGMIIDILKVLGGRYTPSVPLPIGIIKSVVSNDVSNSIFANCPFKQQVVQAFVEPFTSSNVILNPQPIRRSVAYAIGDYIISCPAVLFVSYITEWPTFTGNVFQTRLTYQNLLSPLRSVWSNVTHADDLPLYFGLPSSIPGYTDDDKFISNKWMDLITHFAQTGEVLLLNPTVYGDWPSYSVNNGIVNASYIELHPNTNRLGKVFVNQYRGNDGYFPKDVYNCFNFWEQYILSVDMCIPQFSGY